MEIFHFREETCTCFIVGVLCFRLEEAQSAVLKKALTSKTAGEKITGLILKYIESERNKLQSSFSTDVTTVSRTKSFHTQRGQYTLIYTAGQSIPPVSLMKMNVFNVKLTP